MLQVLPPETEPEVIHASEDRVLVAWQELYPERWLLLEITHEEDGEPLTGRLLAVASTDIALVHRPRSPRRPLSATQNNGLSPRMPCSFNS